MGSHDPKKLLNKDFLCGVIMLLFSGFLYWAVQTQIASKGGAVNSRTVPSLLCAIIALCSVILIAVGIFSSKSTPVVINRQSLADAGKTAAYLLMFVVYAALLEKLGYIVSTALLAAGILANYKLRPKKDWRVYLLVVGLIVGIFFSFRILLDIDLPSLLL